MGGFATQAGVLSDLGWAELTSALAAAAQSERGRARAAALVPLDDRSAVAASLARIEECRALARQGLRLPLAGVVDLADALGRAAKGATLEPALILAGAELIRAAVAVRRFVAGRRDELPQLWLVAQGLCDHAGLAAQIDGALEPSGAVKDSASTALSAYRARARQLHGELKRRVEGMLHDPGFAELLQDNYFSLRNERYVVPVKASFRGRVPGIVHNASQSGQTLFIEPQGLVELGNELAIAESLAAEEERQILAELSAYLGDRAGDLCAALAGLADLDLGSAGAALADRLDAVTPLLGDGPGAPRLLALRHPLLVLQGKRVVGNDVTLEAGVNALVVSGPNAGGKTVTLTAVGLVTLMARAGLPIPVRAGSSVPWHAGLATAIGDAQDLSRDLSTFSAHLHKLKAILAAAGPGWLVLVDEIAADTDPREGAALATAVLERLCAAGALTLVTTHLDELKALGLVDPRFANARMGFDAETLAPTYRLTLGEAGVSNAIEIAARVGLDEAVLARARGLLASGGALSLALARLAEETDAAGRARAAALAAEGEARALAASLEAERRALAEARRDATLTVRGELAAELEEARQQVRAVLAELQRRPTIAAAQQGQRQLEERAAQLAEQQRRLAGRAEPEAPPLEPERLAGARVRVLSLGREGEVLGADRDGALVAVGALRTRVPLADLELVRGAAARGARADAGAGRRAQVAGLVDHGADRCDVRGLYGDEAIREIDRFLDRAACAGLGRVVVVHGHGTGALKKVVREHLGRSPYAASCRPGADLEGGDGVTVVELRG